MREIQISLGLIQRGETYLLQRRKIDPQLGAAGLIGAFGGKIEPNERSRYAASREVSEETSLTLDPNDLEYLGKVDVVSDRDFEKVSIKALVYLAVIDEGTDVVAKEGELVSMNVEEIRQNTDQLTPATRAVFKQLIRENI